MPSTIPSVFFNGATHSILTGIPWCWLYKCDNGKPGNATPTLGHELIEDWFYQFIFLLPVTSIVILLEIKYIIDEKEDTSNNTKLEKNRFI